MSGLGAGWERAGRIRNSITSAVLVQTNRDPETGTAQSRNHERRWWAPGDSGTTLRQDRLLKYEFESGSLLPHPHPFPAGSQASRFLA